MFWVSGGLALVLICVQVVVNERSQQLEPFLGSKLPKVEQLGLGMLVYGADSNVHGGSLHLVKFSFAVLSRTGGCSAIGVCGMLSPAVRCTISSSLSLYAV